VLNQTMPLLVRRHAEGAPILSPAPRWWEDGVTLNPAVTYLPQVESNRALIRQLLAGTVYYNAAACEGLVAVHYRARPKSDPDVPLTRSYVGLALFTPQLDLIYRFPEPVLSPDENETGADYLGVEDPRITRIGDTFVMVYCGSGFDEVGAWWGGLCIAESTDLLHWSKRGRIDLRCPGLDGAKPFDNSYFDNLPGVKGTTLHVSNKDGVLMPESIDGWYYLLHRPMVGKMFGWSMHVARSRSIDGQWTDLGPIAHAQPHADYRDSWLGAGAVPIALGDGRYLEIFHSGHRGLDGSRFYTLGCMLLNFNRLDTKHPEKIVEARIDHFMIPETKWEIEGPFPDSVGNVLFTCGAFELNDDICILYGGGDTFVMAAMIAKSELLSAMIPVVHS